MSVSACFAFSWRRVAASIVCAAVVFATFGSHAAEIATYTTAATSGKFSEIAWSPNTPPAAGGAGVELVFTGANFALENDFEDFAFSRLDLQAKGTLSGKRLVAKSPDGTAEAILRFGVQGAAETAPLYLADNLTVTNDLTPTISGYTRINGVDGDISGPGRLTFRCAHRVNAYGYVSLFGHNTFSGGLDILLGNVIPTNVWALGAGRVYCTNATASVKDAPNYARLWLKNFTKPDYSQTLTNELYVGGQLLNVGYTARFQTDGNFYLTNTVCLHATATDVKVNGYGKWAMKGGVDAGTFARFVWETGGSDNTVEIVPLDMPKTTLLAGHQNDGNKSAVRFKVAGNNIDTLSAYRNAIFAFDVDSAFSNRPTLCPQASQAGMIVELNGTTQTFGPHVDAAGHPPLLIRNTNASKAATVTLVQSQANRLSSLTTSGKMTFVKDGTAALTTTGAFSVNGTLIVRDGLLQLYGTEGDHLAASIVVEGGELDLGGRLHTCGTLTLKGGRITNGTLVCTDRAEIEGGDMAAEIIGTVVKRGTASAALLTAPRLTRSLSGGDLPQGTVFHMNFDDPDNIGRVAVGGADLVAEKTALPTWSADGVSGGCAVFDGATALKSSTYPEALPTGACPYTVSAWVCVSNGCSTSGGWFAYGKSSGTGLGNNFRFSGAQYIRNYWYGMDVYCAATDVNDGRWHHVVGTFDGTTRKVYYDGQCGVSDTNYVPNITRGLVLVGRTLNDTYLTGSVDEILVLDRAASEAEVQDLYAAGAASARTALAVEGGTVRTGTLTAEGAALYYPLASEADLCKDFSGNGKDLVASGAGVTFSTDSPFGKGGSAHFDGTAYLRHNSFPESFPTGNASYTVCMFIRPENTSLINGCFAGYGVNVKYNANHFRLNGFTQICNYWVSEGANLTVRDGDTLADGHWHSFVGTYDSATGRRINYFDGGQSVLTATPAYVPSIVAKNFTLGCDSYRQTEWYTGNLAEVAVFPRAFTADEVRQYHAAGLGGSGLRVAGTYAPGGTVDGDLILADGVSVTGGGTQRVTGDVTVEGDGSYVPDGGAGTAYWDFLSFDGALLGQSAENLKDWTVSACPDGYVRALERGVIRAYSTRPGLLLIVK